MAPGETLFIFLLLRKYYPEKLTVINWVKTAALQESRVQIDKGLDTDTAVKIHRMYRARIFILLWSPGSDLKESIPPAYEAWRAGTITLFLLGS